MKIQTTVAKTINIPIEEIDVEKIIKSLFRRAKKIWEAEINFWKESYIRLSDDWFSYIDFNVEDWFKTCWVWTMMKRSESDILYILSKGLWKL